MSHFYATIHGSRGEASRCGTKASGITGHIRGWRLGGRVAMHHDEIDHVTIAITGGSGAAQAGMFLSLGTWTRDSFGSLQPHDSRALSIFNAIKKEVNN